MQGKNQAEEEEAEEEVYRPIREARPGLAIYGLPPVAAVRERVELRPVMTFKTRLMQINVGPMMCSKHAGQSSKRRSWPNSTDGASSMQ